MNIQTKLYKLQFFSPPDNRFTDWRKFQLAAKKGFNLLENRNAKKNFLSPNQPPFMNWAWHLWYGVFPLDSLAMLSPGPACLLISWLWETGKSPWYHSSNWKHQGYQYSSQTKSKTQQLLGGTLTLLQPKPWQLGTCHLSSPDQNPGS